MLAPRTATVLLSAALAPAAAAQEFAAVNISPSPDTLNYFDITNPAAVTPGFPLVGNFIRGLELEDRDSGWYMATADLSGSPIGFFRLQDGVSTMVAPMPFESTTVGGLTFNQGATGLFAAIDPPDARPDTLFAVDFAGTFTEIGPITLPGGLLPEIAGLALDPSTGTLYALDNANETILVVDPGTGAATSLGASGVTFAAVGGLDVIPGSPSRLIAASGARVYEVNLTTGAATLLGQLPFSTSSIAYTAPGPLPCYPDCDTSTGVGVLDIFDFLCFQNRYDAGTPYACDCDTTTGPGVCDIFDFLCFQNAYDAGCP